MKKMISIRLDTELIKKSGEIAKHESDRLNYKISKTAVIEKAVSEFIQNYKVIKI